MASSKTSKSASVLGNRNISFLSYIPQFMKPYLMDAIEIPDFDTLSSILRIKRKEAEKVVIRNNEDLAGYKAGDVFCTKKREGKRRVGNKCLIFQVR